MELRSDQPSRIPFSQSPGLFGGLATILVSVLVSLAPSANAQEPVKGAHEDLAPGATTDDLGITIGGFPASHPARRYPAGYDYPTGPDIGERLPDFRLSNQNGKQVDFHQDRGDSKAIVVFFRSAVW